MTEPSLAPPAADEHAPFYAGYIAGVSGADVLGLLRRQPAALHAACAGLRDEEARRGYAPGKWSAKEVLGHLCDTERVMAYRLLRFSRGDTTPVPGFDQDDYVRAAGFDDRSVEALLAEFDAVRASTVAMVRHLSPEQLARRGTANGAEVSVRALVYIIAGHAQHHFRLLHDRYGLAVTTPEAEMEPRAS